MSAYSRVFVQEIDDLPPPTHARRSQQAERLLSISGDYGHTVPPPVEVRKKAFAAFIRRALVNAETDRGWSIPRVAKEAGIGNPTIYRWRDGDWAKAPSPDAVLAFCDALDIDPRHAFAILWPGKNEAAPLPEPAPMDPDMERLMRRLRDPKVTEAEKITIRATIRHLVNGAPSTTPKK